MNTILLRIVMHGLVALALDQTGGGSNHLTAFLVNAHALPQGVTDQCFAEHMPMISVDPKNNSDCNAITGCAINTDTNLCDCHLDGREVSLQMDPPLADPPLWTDKSPGSHPLPFNAKEAASLTYVTNLTEEFGLILDPQLLTSAPPDTLAARMDFPFESITSCALAVRPDEGGRNVHAMSFRMLGFLERPGDISHAVSQQVLTKLTLSDNTTLALRIRSFDASDEHLLPLKPGADGYFIDLSNMRHDDMKIDDPCDDGIGRDFAFFYQLAQNKPAWADRKIPHVKLTRWKSSSDLQPLDCLDLLDHAPSSRPICPMGSFDL
jgi:hypothetical protein